MYASISNRLVDPGAVTCWSSRSTVMLSAGSLDTALDEVADGRLGEHDGQQADLVQLLRKMSAKLGATIARNPWSSSAQTACSRLEPLPKFGPVKQDRRARRTRVG